MATFAQFAEKYGDDYDTPDALEAGYQQHQENLRLMQAVFADVPLAATDVPTVPAWTDGIDLWEAATAILPAVTNTTIRVMNRHGEPYMTVTATVDGDHTGMPVTFADGSSVSWQVYPVPMVDGPSERALFLVECVPADIGEAVGALLGLLSAAAVVGAHGDDAPTEVVSQ